MSEPPHPGRGHRHWLAYDEPRDRSLAVVVGVGAAALATVLGLQTLVGASGLESADPTSVTSAVGDPPDSPPAPASPASPTQESSPAPDASATVSPAASASAPATDATGPAKAGSDPLSTRAGVAVPAVGFAVGSVTPDGAALPTIDRVAALVLELDARIVVEGHADASGDPALELELSRRRAAVVAELLVTRGVPAGRIALDPRGAEEADQVTADGSDATGNRRVTFAVLTD